MYSIFAYKVHYIDQVYKNVYFQKWNQQELYGDWFLLWTWRLGEPDSKMLISVDHIIGGHIHWSSRYGYVVETDIRSEYILKVVFWHNFRTVWAMVNVSKRSDRISNTFTTIVGIIRVKNQPAVNNNNNNANVCIVKQLSITQHSIFVSFLRTVYNQPK